MEEKEWVFFWQGMVELSLMVMCINHSTWCHVNIRKAYQSLEFSEDFPCDLHVQLMYLCC